MIHRLGGPASGVLIALIFLHGDAMAATPDVAVTVTSQTVETAAGLHVATFDTLQGTVSVNLPDDMAAGDTISVPSTLLAPLGACRGTNRR